MPTESTTEKSVTLHISAEEFQLLATLMAPLYFNETSGASIWVSSNSPSTRRWVVRDSDDRYSVVKIDGIANEVRGFEPDDTAWSFPVAESILVCVGKMRMISSNDPMITLTLSDSTIVLEGASLSLSIPQNHKAVAPPIVPDVPAVAGFGVDGPGLWCILGEAKRWPASGDCTGLNPPMMGRVDPVARELVITVDWTSEDHGVCTYRLPATDIMCPGDEPLEFAMPHSAILEVLRDPFSGTNLGAVHITVPGPDGTHVLLTGESWEYYAPVVRENRIWGQDLGEVMGDTFWKWVNAGHLHVWPDDFEHGPIRLVRLPEEAAFGPYEYRASCVICEDVVPNNDLYNEINAINSGSGGFRLVVDGTRVLAISDYTSENYRDLGSHLEKLAVSLKDIGSLLHPLAVAVRN